MLDLVNQFVGDQSITCAIIPSIHSEIHAGKPPSLAFRVSDLNDLSFLPNTKVYSTAGFSYPSAKLLRPDLPPVPDFLRGDLKVRSEIEQLLRMLDAQRGTDKVFVVFFTHDLGCLHLIKSIRSPSPDVVFWAIHFTQTLDRLILRESLVSLMKKESVQ
jgi:hypothetical protein